jgi:type IV pilus assembly protein PilO
MAEKKKADKRGALIQQKLALVFERVGKLSRLNRLFICIVTLLLIGGGYYYLIFMSMHAQLQEAEQTLEAQTNKLNIVKRKASSLKEWENKMAQVEEAFYIATRALPDKKEVPSLLKSVSRAGSSAGLSVILFQPAQEVNKDFYREIPLSMKVEGSFHQIADFFYQVSRLNRIVNIRHISMKRNKSAPGTIDMSCNAVTYMFVEEVPETQQGKNNKKG